MWRRIVNFFRLFFGKMQDKEEFKPSLGLVGERTSNNWKSRQLTGIPRQKHLELPPIVDAIDAPVKVLKRLPPKQP